MNRSVFLTVGLIVAMGAVAYGQTFRGEPNFQNPRVVAGEVATNGTVVQGSGFTSQLVSTGQYRLRFNRGVFLNGCPIVTVTPAIRGLAPIASVYTETCSRTVDVFLHWSAGDAADTPFNFTAVGT